MLLVESIIITVSTILVIIPVYWIFKAFKNSPILESRILLTAILFVNLSFLLSIPSGWLSNPGGTVSNVTQILFKLSWVTVFGSLLMWKLVLLIPNFNARYRNIALIIIISIIDTLGAITSYLGNEVHIQGNYLVVTFGNIGGLAFLLSLIFLVYLGYGRIKEISSTLQAQDKELINTKYSLLFFACVFLTIIANAISSLNPGYLPATLPFIPQSLIIVIFVFAIVREHSHFLFVLPIELYACIITVTDIGNVVYTKSFGDVAHPEEILGGMLTALNISLMDAIEANQNLEQISFGDKVMHISNGKVITTLLITSHQTMMTTQITKFLTKQFEEKLLQRLKETEYGAMKRESDFEEFDNTLNNVSEYFLKN